jgi:GNAT superfamily N-acetyltransferase
MHLQLRAAEEEDLPLLAAMNRRLIEDEGSRNPMSADALRRRMADWLRGDWSIDLFVENDTIVGYAVYQLRPDEYNPAQTVVYLRQLYVEREARGRGIGRRMFEMLAQARLPADCPVVIDVLASNPGGRRFWERLGFRPYCTTMTWQRQ